VSKSKPLLRTNPKLSSNLKLIVSDDLYLTSIPADDLIADNIFKNVPLNPHYTYAEQISNFWGRKFISKDLIYKFKKNSPDNLSIQDYKFQYERDYCYGAERLISKTFKEEFSIFAPLWLNKEIPKKFVIFKLKDAGFVYEKNPTIIKKAAYHPMSSTSSFTSYSKDNFIEKDQIELSGVFKELDKKGCLVMLSNSNTPLIRELYKNYNIHEVQVARSINSKASGRSKISELVVTNYES
jgi:hypothetical protein